MLEGIELTIPKQPRFVNEDRVLETIDAILEIINNTSAHIDAKHVAILIRDSVITNVSYGIEPIIATATKMRKLLLDEKLDNGDGVYEIITTDSLEKVYNQICRGT